MRLKFLIFTTAGSPYLDSRNTRCAIFSINTRQTLKKQADESVDFIWHIFEHDCVVLKQKCDHSHSLPFCQPRPVGPEYLGCPAEDKKISVNVFTKHIGITVRIQCLITVSCFLSCTTALPINFKGQH